jgi:hypothetical protein
MFRLLSALLAFSLAANGIASAEAGSWVTVRDDPRITYQLDITTLRGTPASRTITMRRLFKVRDERAYALDTLEIDCLTNQYRFRDIVIYDSDHLVTHRYRLTDQFCPVPPGSYLASVRTTACSDRP